MAETADGRVYKRKRLTDPTDENTYLDIPVLTEAKFKSMADQAQEFFVYFDNSENSSRKVHTKRVTNNQDSSQYIDVERIEEWHVKTMQEQAQESTFVLSNNDPPPMQPDGGNNPAHEQTHIVRYFKDNDSSSDTWCDVELIDELKIKCMAEQAQEYIWFTKNPELGDQVQNSDVSYNVTVGYCDPGLELDSGQSPYRLDPFRNIVNINWVSEESLGCEFDGDYTGFVTSAIQFDGDDSWGTFIYVGGIVQDGPRVNGRGAAIAAMEAFGAEAVTYIKDDWGRQIPTWWYVGGYEDGIALYMKPASQGNTCQVGTPGFQIGTGGYGFYGAVCASYNATGPIYATGGARNPYTGAPVEPDPLHEMLPFDGMTYFDGFAYWGWGTSAAFEFDANQLDYLATTQAPQLAGMLSIMAAEVRAFGQSMEGLPPEGDPPTAAIRQFSLSTVYYSGSGI